MLLKKQSPQVKSTVFPPRRDYSSLSLQDLLETQEAYHVHLSSLDYVLATAIGRYCIHEKDWYAENPPDRPRPGNVANVTVARTLACLVRRGGTYYALTNRHVAGGNGEEVHAYVRGERVRVGSSTEWAVDREKLANIFPQWSGSSLNLRLDAGLIEIDEINNWMTSTGVTGRLFRV